MYVDDIIIVGNNINKINYITFLLDQIFKIKDLGNMKYFLVLKVILNKTSIHFMPT